MPPQEFPPDVPAAAARAQAVLEPGLVNARQPVRPMRTRWRFMT